MQVFTKDEYMLKKELFHKKIIEGEIFIYPTDTIYGIGCNATDEEAIQKVRKIKDREDKPFSIIAPSKAWIYENCEITEKVESWLEKLPGPYTLILNLKKESAIAKNVNPKGGTIGVRIPDYWTSELASELGIPIITPSANISGKEPMTSLEDLDPKMKSRTDFMLDEGVKKGSPSKIIDLTGEEEIILR